jgi:hypothetical protein
MLDNDFKVDDDARWQDGRISIRTSFELVDPSNSTKPNLNGHNSATDEIDDDDSMKM